MDHSTAESDGVLLIDKASLVRRFAKVCAGLMLDGLELRGEGCVWDRNIPSQGLGNWNKSIVPHALT